MTLKEKTKYHDSSLTDLNCKQTDITANVPCLASGTAVKVYDNVPYMHLDLGNKLYGLICALYLEASRGLMGELLFY